jgi:hypothetical protein
MHSGNSSTLARLRPRSKMRIFASGTPRLKRDLGYYSQNISPALSMPCTVSLVALTYRLVLAVPVAAGGSPGHCVGGWKSGFKSMSDGFVGSFVERERITARECQYGISGCSTENGGAYPDFMWWFGGEVKEQRRTRRLTIELGLIRNCGS